MRRKLFGMFVLAATLSACAPYRIEYEHLVLQDVPELEVLERSKPQKTPPVEKSGVRSTDCLCWQY